MRQLQSNFKLPRLGESALDKDGVGMVIKKYREATKSRRCAEETELPDPLAEKLASIESRLDTLEAKVAQSPRARR